MARLDQAREAFSAISSWNLAPALHDFIVSNSDVQGYGGFTVYEYGHSGSTAGLTLAGVQNLMAQSEFGMVQQSVASQSNAGSVVLG